MRLRTETPADHEAVAAVVTAAFGRTQEALLVDLVRRSEHFDPHLSLVAETGGRIVGHVLFSRVGLQGSGPAEVYALAPLAVHPDHQRIGIGSALVEEGLRRLDAMGEPLVVLEGIPSYYPRFGFVPASQHGMSPPDSGVPDEAFMIRRLAGYDPAIVGTIAYPSAFYASEALGP
ncbi:MAG: N-acetyltransferase [Actinobacteria bacterium]|nr:N-acetyltransferase [Actinomycetota bacterium]MBU1493488.1 N-acetyltransferase [Actinomycetota bacterium]